MNYTSAKKLHVKSVDIVHFARRILPFFKSFSSFSLDILTVIRLLSTKGSPNSELIFSSILGDASFSITTTGKTKPILSLRNRQGFPKFET